jgi:hypothetical protein
MCCGSVVAQYSSTATPHTLYHPFYSKVSSPFQAQHLPFPTSIPNPLTTSNNLSAAYSGVNSFSSFTLPQNSFDNPVLTAPGCSAIADAFSAAVFRRYKSNVLVRLLTRALLARYEYHPPRELSLVEPTRADMVAQTAWGGRLSSAGCRSGEISLWGGRVRNIL